MTRTLVTGATGTLGSALVPRLQAAGHDVRAASRSPPDHVADATDVEWVPLDLADGTGVERAVADVDVVVHAATAPSGDSEAVDVHGTERLLDAAADAGVAHVVYPSIVGIDEIPLSYYEDKRAAEERVEASPVPSTVVRATQFHQFLADLLDGMAWLPAWPLPTDFRVQPVDAREVADALVEHADGDPRGRAPPVCGPEVLTGREIATAYRDARGRRRIVVRLPLPGAVASAFRAGDATCRDAAGDANRTDHASDAKRPDRTDRTDRTDRAVGTTTWREWLADPDAPRVEGPSDASPSP